jgi:hypothetical protein
VKSEPNTTEFQQFDDLMGKLLAVPHSELKAKLEAEKRQKTKEQKAKPSASSRASRPNAG